MDSVLGADDRLGLDCLSSISRSSTSFLCASVSVRLAFELMLSRVAQEQAHVPPADTLQLLVYKSESADRPTSQPLLREQPANRQAQRA